VRRGQILGISLVLLALVLAACRPVKDPPPAQPAPPPLPAAPSGASVAPAVFVNGDGTTQPFGAPDPDVISVDARYCASIPAIPPTTTTSTTTTSTTSTTAPPPTTEPLPPAGAPGCYYAYSTPTIRFAPTAVPASRSKDLVHWFPAGTPDAHGNPSGVAFDGNVPGAEFPLWAPSVMEIGANNFVMWFSEKATSYGSMCLWSATASTPDGPFLPVAGPYCNPAYGGVIDPAPFVDNNGALYLTYKGEGSTSPSVPTRIYEAQLTPTGVQTIGGSEHQLLEVLPSPSFEFPIVEAPTYMRSPGGSLFLFYSAFDWFTADYKVAVAKCDSPVGPCNRVYSTPLVASRDTMLGPGGQTPFQDAAGNWQLAFHAWAAADLNATPLDGARRTLRILPITFPDGNPKVG
jgi:beta-xylosidase